MKRYKLAAAFLVVLLLTFTSCKRSKVVDPGSGGGPTGHPITLTGTANPSTIYVKEFQTVSTLLTIAAVIYDGSRAVGKTIIFEAADYGKFQGTGETTITRTTDINGEARVEYVFPAGTDVRVASQTLVTAYISDAEMADNTYIYTTVPLTLVPWETNDYIEISGAILETDSKTGIKGVGVEATDSNGIIYTGVSGSGGAYTIIIPGAASTGFSGTITPSRSGYTFSPSSLNIPEETASYVDIDTDFYANATETINVDFDSFDFGWGGGTIEVYIYCLPSTTYRTTFTANTADVDWITVGLSEFGTFYSHVTGRTPKFLWIKVQANYSEDSRSGSVVIIATGQDSIGTVSVGIEQEGIPAPE
ncbi:MAG: BACON domain-containing protein [Candidatus Aminicenantes bacterium]|nr:BACON domain-containing protein [Candidatus Aminicenantes bacterium]